MCGRSELLTYEAQIRQLHFLGWGVKPVPGKLSNNEATDVDLL